MAVVAAATAALAVALGLRGPLRLPPTLRHRSRARVAGPVLVALVAGLTAVAVLSSALTGRHLVLALLGAAATVAALRLVQRGRRAAGADRRSEQVLAACEAVAADLVAGQPPLSALERAAAAWPELQPAVVAGRLGADVPAALRALAVRPGGAELRVLAAAWQVAHESGCGLAEAVGAAAGAIRARRATRRLVGTELAAARATARLMAVLPFGVLVLGAGVGGDPVGFLLDTTPGVACLGAGLLLGYVGMIWLQRIADRVLER